jgi:hypothetical protein
MQAPWKKIRYMTTPSTFSLEGHHRHHNKECAMAPCHPPRISSTLWGPSCAASAILNACWNLQMILSRSPSILPLAPPAIISPPLASADRRTPGHPSTASPKEGTHLRLRGDSKLHVGPRIRIFPAIRRFRSTVPVSRNALEEHRRSISRGHPCLWMDPAEPDVPIWHTEDGT